MQQGILMDVRKAKKVALFGGSFNPPHIGHVEICTYLLERGDSDEVWIVPCYRHPFGKVLAPFDDRLTMCRFTFQDFMERVIVSDVEKRLGGVSHTVRTIEYLKGRHPETEFSLVVGGDVAGEKDDWKDFERIQEMIPLIEIPRGKDSFITDISSTEIRRMVKTGVGFSRFIATPVAVYIATHGLYQSY